MSHIASRRPRPLDARMTRRQPSPGIGAVALRGATRLVGHATNRPMTTVAIVVSAALAAAIVVNAVGLQRGSHPAPLFAGRPHGESRAPAPAAEPRTVAAPAPRSPGQDAPQQPSPSTLSAPSIAPPVRPATLGAGPATTASAPPSRDPIGDLLRQSERPVAREAAPAAPAAPSGDSRIAAAQRALIKLGYGPLKVDGVAGIGTRLAIESFEKDRRLPLTGELTPRLQRELAAASGIAIE